MSEQFKTSSENLNQNQEIPQEQIISSKINNIWEKSAENIEKKIKLSYEWLKELITFITQKENEKIKVSLEETLAGINFSETDKKELNTLKEIDFQSLKEWIVSNNSIAENIKETYTYTLDKHVQDIFSDSRRNNAIHNTSNNLSHHIDGCIVWATQSIVVLWKITIEIVTDTLKFPYHCGLLLSWKAKTDAFENI